MTTAATCQPVSDAASAACPTDRGRRVPVGLLWLLATVAVGAVMLGLSAGANVAPVIEADNAYIFMAADRLFTGEGATAIPPRAPLQPWSWRADWVFLTQWPVGYPALICATRWVTGLATARAAMMLGALSCAIGLGAWFAWARACLPRRIPALLIAVVVAGASFSVQDLVHPASDTVLVGLLPVVLLLVCWAQGMSRGVDGSSTEPRRNGFVRPLIAGLAAGLLVWVRYAAIFVPLAVVAYFVVAWRMRRGVRGRDVVIVALAAGLPCVALFMLNRALGPGVSAQAQLNLGESVSWDWDITKLHAAWTHFARQTPYAHRPEAFAFYTLLLPVLAWGIPLVTRATRRDAWRLMGTSPMLLSALTCAALLALLIAASVLFADKYNYVAQARYYAPMRPLYFVLFLGPLTIWPHRWLRLAACVPLVLVASWFVNQDARRVWARMHARPTVTTAYGRQSRYFGPHSRELFDWLRGQASADLVVFSNFHEEIALETGIPACPTPPDAVAMSDWLARIREHRAIDEVRVLFVLAADNDYREYYLPPREVVIDEFGLTAAPDAPQVIRDLVSQPNPQVAVGEQARESEPGARVTGPIKP
jgi:hypothetical protein